jgi:DNA polymerase-1
MRREIPVVLATQDKDAEQLVRDATEDGACEIVVWDGKAVVRDELAVTQHRGVGPRRLAELWALSGDAGDDIPGVPRWREKTAAKVLLSSPRHSLDDLLKDGAQYYVPATYRAVFVANRDVIKMARKLVELRGEQAARYIRADELEVDPLLVAESLRNSAASAAGGDDEGWSNEY